MLKMKCIRTQATLQPCLIFLYNIHNSFVITHQNVRSLHRHYHDVINDSSLTSVDVLICTESRLAPSDSNDDYNIEGFDVFRNDDATQQPTRPYHGTVIYSKFSNLQSTPRSLNQQGTYLTLTVHKTLYGIVQVISVYRSPAPSVDAFLNAFNNLMEMVEYTLPTVILGDFNVDLFQQNASTRKITKLMTETYNYTQLVMQPTTDYGSCLDHIYTNIHTARTGVLESYYSDHKPIWISI